MKKWKPQDVIACVVVLGCFILLIMGRDSYISWTLLGVVGLYYGVDLTPFIKLGRNQKPPKEE